MLSVVILSYNRREALRRTLRELDSQGLIASAEVIVVDNASTDGSAQMVRDEFPSLVVVGQSHNTGIAGFNAGAARATQDLLLILDDDSWPDPAGLAGAVGLLETQPTVAAVALLPKHPATLAPEWGHIAPGAHSGWPIMGCGNIVRRAAWQRVEGYEPGFFLYRNDTDLALKLLAAGDDVWFDPAWVVWHDSPVAGRKSDRWLHLATRNWGWMSRRHGRGLLKILGMVAGAAWAMRLAGWSLKRQGLVMRGVWESVSMKAPGLPKTCRVDGRAYSELVRLQIRGR